MLYLVRSHLSSGAECVVSVKGDRTFLRRREVVGVAAAVHILQLLKKNKNFTLIREKRNPNTLSTLTSPA